MSAGGQRSIGWKSRAAPCSRRRGHGSKTSPRSRPSTVWDWPASSCTGCSAARAGLRAGDQVTRCQDRAVNSLADLERRADRVVAGELVRVTVKRNNKDESIEFKEGEGL